MTDREIMQQALEALTAYDGTNGASQRKRVLAALRDRLAQPEQEPVACPYCKNSATLGALYYDQNCVGCVKRMTTPPQRTWQGLTDEEIEQGCKESWVTEQAFQSAVWWAEARLKEKNT